MGDQASRGLVRRDAAAVLCLANIFYTLLYHGTDGYRREDLSEEAWQTRNENIRLFHFGNRVTSRCRPKPTEPVPKESAEQLFRRLMASDSPPANACLRPGGHARTKTCFETSEDRIPRRRETRLIYEQGSTGDVFIVPDPQLRLDELENVQNEVAELLRGAAQNG
jgi:hypothetical protein